MTDKTLNCCFTGYRPAKFPFKFSADDPRYAAFENSLLEAIFSLPKENCFTFYTGMAMGFDILAAEMVLLLKEKGDCVVNLICVLPFKNQTAGWDEDWKKRYDNVLKNADEVILLSEEYYKGCYFKRNNFMVDNSDLVLTYFDGAPGGTAATLKYAAQKNKKIINLADSDESPLTYRDYISLDDIPEEDDE